MSGEAVTGVWYGRWSSEDPDVYPNSFIAMLDEVDGAIDGSVSEPDLIDGGLLHAQVHGGRSGAQVHWIKQYDGAGRLAHGVYYAGLVNADATEITGGWRLGEWSGGFTMQREKFAAEALEDEVELEVGMPDGRV